MRVTPKSRSVGRYAGAVKSCAAVGSGDAGDGVVADEEPDS
jgi:hypothetical protein